MMLMSQNKNNSFFSEWSELLIILKRYWRAFGGCHDFVRSPFFHIAIILTVLLNDAWSNNAWYSTAIGVLPNMLGFCVSGYAIWISWGDEKFRAMLMGLQNEKALSQYVHVSAIFAHFAIVQVLALVFALLASGLTYVPLPDSLIGFELNKSEMLRGAIEIFTPVFYGVGYLLFIYSILCALEATLALFRVATWFQIKYDTDKEKAESGE